MEEDKKMEDFYTLKNGVATITNLPEFVKAGLRTGQLIAKKAKKVAPVIFESSTEDYVNKYGDGEQATLDVEFNLGEEGKYIETTETVKPNPNKFIARGAKYGEPWQVNRSNYEDTPLTKDDIIGNLDIDDNVKANLLKALEDGKEIYMPTPDNRYTVKIDIPEVNEIRFQAPWTEKVEYQSIKNGGYVVFDIDKKITECNKVDMFGNQKFSYLSSYKEEEGEYNQEFIDDIDRAQMRVIDIRSTNRIVSIANYLEETDKEKFEYYVKKLRDGLNIWAPELKPYMLTELIQRWFPINSKDETTLNVYSLLTDRDIEDIKERFEEIERQQVNEENINSSVSSNTYATTMPTPTKAKTSFWSKIVSKIKSFFGKEKNSDYIKTNEHYKKESEKRWKEELQNYKDEECDEKGNYLSIGQNRDEYLPNGMSKAAYIDAHEKGEKGEEKF